MSMFQYCCAFSPNYNIVSRIRLRSLSPKWEGNRHLLCHNLSMKSDPIIGEENIDSNHYESLLKEQISSNSNIKTASKQSFYERINKPRTVAAPMVAQSDLAFRKLCRNHGTDLAYTQMIHAKSFVKSKNFQDSHLDIYKPFHNDAATAATAAEQPIKLLPSQIDALRSHRNENMEGFFSSPEHYVENGPLIVQLAGHDPQTMVEAAQIILDRTDSNISGIDVNLGCPQTIARKGKYGAFLLHEDIDLVIQILSSLRSSLPHHVGVSAKIRIPLPTLTYDSLEQIGPQQQESILQKQVKRMITEGGIDMLTVHGRTLTENKTKVRQCNWDMIQKAAEVAKQYQIPIIANGGIEHPSDVQRCLDYTKTNAVMSSEALLENPSLFELNAKDESEMTTREIFNRQIELSMEYLDLAYLTPPLPGFMAVESGSFNVIRGHLFKFLYRYLERNQDLRLLLGSHKGDMRRISEARALVNTLYERHETMPDDEMEKWYKGEGDDVPTSWYRRHRKSMVLSHTKEPSGHLQNSVQDLSTEEKKKAIMERILKLKKQKEERKFGGVRC